MAISCLSAEEARADAAKESLLSSANFREQDVNGMVASMIAADFGAPCEVRTLQLFGRSASTRSTIPVACTDGRDTLRVGNGFPDKNTAGAATPRSRASSAS